MNKYLLIVLCWVAILILIELHSIEPEDPIPLEFKGVVEYAENERGVTLLKLEGQKPIYLPLSKNYHNSPSGLSVFLKPGDSLINRKGSDTLYIRRMGIPYHFIIGNPHYNR